MPESLKDLRSMTVDELRGRENELREEVAKLQMQRYARRLDKSSDLGDRKKDLARVMTVAIDKRRDEAPRREQSDV
jgi:ribosomal protein L29